VLSYPVCVVPEGYEPVAILTDSSNWSNWDAENAIPGDDAGATV
jgi:hypothetical protein